MFQKIILRFCKENPILVCIQNSLKETNKNESNIAMPMKKLYWETGIELSHGDQ